LPSVLPELGELPLGMIQEQTRQREKPDEEEEIQASIGMELAVPTLEVPAPLSARVLLRRGTRFSG
jgi:hypothetical protein